MAIHTGPVAHQVAGATPVERDRFADLLRVASILVVVAGHWLMAVVVWRDGRVQGGNALALVPGLWLATWLLQVMPLFFFVGGLANLVSARGGGSWARLVRRRAARLLRPTVAFLAVWAVVAAALGLAGVPEAVLRPVARLVVQPLWFLGLYLLVVALAPAMLRLHRQFGPAVVVWLGLAAATADLLSRSAEAVDLLGRVPGLDRVGELNYLLVWLFAHQLGFLYADGTLPGWSRRAHAAMAAGGLAALVALTASGAWPPSMVGLPGDRVSNMSPPSLCIVALTVWLVGLAMLVRPPVTRWLERPAPWTLVVTAGSALMTLFLWHLTALVLTVLVLHPLGLTEPAPGTPVWWALRPLWVLVPAALLVPLVALFARFERPRSTVHRPPRPTLWTTAGTRSRHGLRSPSGGPDTRPGRCRLAGVGGATVGGATVGGATVGGATAATALGTAAAILGLLGIAVGGIWPLPGAAGDLVGIRISPGMALVSLGAGAVLLRPVGSRGE
jgi:fucose 4-O-acetylase-like acetyltransferase